MIFQHRRKQIRKKRASKLLAFFPLRYSRVSFLSYQYRIVHSCFLLNRPESVCRASGNDGKTAGLAPSHAPAPRLCGRAAFGRLPIHPKGSSHRLDGILGASSPSRRVKLPGRLGGASEKPARIKIRSLFHQNARINRAWTANRADRVSFPSSAKSAGRFLDGLFVLGVFVDPLWRPGGNL